MKTFALATAILACLLFSCSKDDDDDAPSNTSLLTKADWKWINVELDTATGVYFSYLPYLEACDKDDITTFKSDFTYKVVEGASKCDTGDPDEVERGTWQFSSDEKILILSVQSPTTGTYTFNVESLTETSLVTTMVDGQFRSRFTYGH